MQFLKRTWYARLGLGLNKFIIGEKDANGKQTLTNSPDSVSQIGDVISADNLNNLETRIETAFLMSNLTKVWENDSPSDPYPATLEGIPPTGATEFLLEYTVPYKTSHSFMHLTVGTNRLECTYIDTVSQNPPLIRYIYRDLEFTSSSIGTGFGFSDCLVWRAENMAVGYPDNTLFVPIAIYTIGDIYNT